MIQALNPSELDELKLRLFAALSNANSYAYTYQKLFMREDLVNKMNQIAAPFFGHYQTLLLDMLVLELAKLYDRKKINKHETVSFDLLIDRLDAEGKAELHARYSVIKDWLLPLRQIRNSSIAHTDLQVRKDELNLAWEQIDEALKWSIGLFKRCFPDEGFIFKPEVQPLKSLENFLQESL